jgi:hypothetical protein
MDMYDRMLSDDVLPNFESRCPQCRGIGESYKDAAVGGAETIMRKVCSIRGMSPVPGLQGHSGHLNASARNRDLNSACEPFNRMMGLTETLNASVILLLGKETWIQQHAINWMMGLELSPWLHCGIPESNYLLVLSMRGRNQMSVFQGCSSLFLGCILHADGKSYILLSNTCTCKF